TANCFNKSKGVFITDPKLKALLNPQPSWGFSGHKKGPVVKLSLHVLCSQLCHVFTELLCYFSSFRAAKIMINLQWG
ncbi:hypothetical protein PSU99_20600, partial [Yersinia pestis]|nr:hypothetical protein [Yersinia pestis]